MSAQPASYLNLIKGQNFHFREQFKYGPDDYCNKVELQQRIIEVCRHRRQSSAQRSVYLSTLATRSPPVFPEALQPRKWLDCGAVGRSCCSTVVCMCCRKNCLSCRAYERCIIMLSHSVPHTVLFQGCGTHRGVCQMLAVPRRLTIGIVSLFYGKRFVLLVGTQDAHDQGQLHD